MKVYTMPERLKVFILLFSILLIITFGSLLIIPFIPVSVHSFAFRLHKSWPPEGFLFYVVLLFLILMIAICVLLLCAVFKRKVVFTNDAIINSNLFSTKKLNFNEIKGFGVEYSTLYIETNSTSKKRLKIDLISLNKTDNLLQDLEMRFINLDYLKPE
ncbi:hypothetical protein IRZ71_11965 [Flavobacterium sp. ANB]|uniref:hypothetical protein n=1 Tax=unclassified Flavobacterium TaxID=196869 RepID=UPI0012BA23E4|nr:MULTISPECIES: hypothetical protein [unclassified Flavobacterium]MBF4517069.1 hypothetical protein [Flavobacterium sp. ANB]MTD71806.1 hypothetical protein [Flavobacterium sp. LC2016-13]